MEISDNLNLNIQYPIYGQNYLYPSEDFFSSTVWTKSNVSSITANAIANPVNGQQIGYAIAGSSTNSNFYNSVSTTGLGTNVIFSVFAKANTSTNFQIEIEFDENQTTGNNITITLNVNLVLGTINSLVTKNCVSGSCSTISNGTREGRIISVGNGWYRISLFTPVKTYTGFTTCYCLIYPSPTASNKSSYVWGAQLESTGENRYPYSYTSTLSSIITTTSNYVPTENKKEKIGSVTQTFTSSGTWAKPAGAKFVKVIAHGGGGSGSLGTYGNYVFYYFGRGGGSGAPGSMAETFISADNLPDTVSVTVGSGGVGPASSATPASGTDGGSSSFGSYLSAMGGPRGLHGAPSVFGGTAANLPSNGINFANVFSNAYSAGQGGAGGNSSGSSSSSFNSGNSGFPGSYIRIGSNVLVGNNGGNSFSTKDGSAGISRSGSGFGGDGGGGGAGSAYNIGTTYDNSGAGGTGGTPGGGGGGAGGRFDSSGLSGKGGDGGNGEIIVITYF